MDGKLVFMQDQMTMHDIGAQPPRLIECLCRKFSTNQEGFRTVVKLSNHGMIHPHGRENDVGQLWCIDGWFEISEGASGRILSYSNAPP